MAPVKTLVVTCALFLTMCFIANGIPTEVHAFCNIVWLFGIPCDQVSMAIVSQIKSMGSYELGPVTDYLIQAQHTSSFGQVEGVNFTFIPKAMSMGCHVEGASISALWSSLYDNGTNYCNLHNVIQGSGLSKVPGFTEFTNEWLCLGSGVSECKDYDTL